MQINGNASIISDTEQLGMFYVGGIEIQMA